MPEKLLTIKEVAEYLKISEEEIKRLADMGVIPAYKIGDTFLRFRKEQIDAVKPEIFSIDTEGPERAKPTLDSRGRLTHPYSDLEQDIKRKAPIVSQYDYTIAERIRDFFYFNDFYILCCIIIVTLIYFIFR